MEYCPSIHGFAPTSTSGRALASRLRRLRSNGDAHPLCNMNDRKDIDDCGRGVNTALARRMVREAWSQRGPASPPAPATRPSAFAPCGTRLITTPPRKVMFTLCYQTIGLPRAIGSAAVPSPRVIEVMSVFA
ncbi:unnamed protein product [Leptosia nina]|uniref:Uncharacterized protein n=1 Tax=Leptosia nina TaxID=320188 RepID=A0AAV1J7F3_9NEOP